MKRSPHRRQSGTHPPRNQQATMKHRTEWKKNPAGKVFVCVVGAKQHMSYAMVTGVSEVVDRTYYRN
jgi:molybdopterin-biosynthesis enzyme MoeA-like protein